MAKNIVLLSDGTGNSAAQLLKTNVWRVYEALKLDDPTRQVACYDDGVGTSSFKPLALVGGAFGVGLKRNVLRLYRFLCEHYEPGDRIYAFGFSRGAFTIRVLVGLICDQGIIKTRPPVAGPAQPAPPADPDVSHSVYGSDLARLTRWAYRDFRRQFNQTGGLVTAARTLRDVTLCWLERVRRQKPYRKGWNREVPSIEFVGVWDTVDAYGLPIDELTDGIDQWVWPLSMPEYRLSQKVLRGCHALALDDERNTFHPVLWDEAGEPQGKTTHICDERISQVWFAGMHSNVGGGYADDALSCVSLNWMTTQAKARGLVFWPELLEHHLAKADPLGRIYDSRSGLKAYYRYNPRRIEWLTNGQEHEKGFFHGTWPKPSATVTVKRPKIHESVLERIAAAPEAYAPIVLPKDYAVVMRNGDIRDGAAHPFERATVREARDRAQETVWDLVWRRRVVYFATVPVSVLLALLPFREAATEAIRQSEQGFATRAVCLVGYVLPSMASPWVRYYAAKPWHLVVGGIALLLLMGKSGSLQAKICDTMRSIWLQVTTATDAELGAIEAPQGALYKLRSAAAYRGAFAVLRRIALPTLFGLATLLCLAGVINRVPFEAVNVAGKFCRGNIATAKPLEHVGDSQTFQFASNSACTAGKVRLDAKARYRIKIEGQESWRDGSVPVGKAAGFTWLAPGLSPLQRLIFSMSLPFRRIWSANWFVPIARIGESGLDHYPLTSETSEITARTSGELFVFVNDAILPIRLWPPSIGWSSYYENNQGTGTVTVTRIEPPASTATPSPCTSGETS